MNLTQVNYLLSVYDLHSDCIDCEQFGAYRIHYISANFIMKQPMMTEIKSFSDPVFIGIGYAHMDYGFGLF